MRDTAWCSLPNAALIDWVLASLKKNPQLWNAARETDREMAWKAAVNTVWNTAWSAAVDAARDAAVDAAWNATWDAWPAARKAAWNSMMALIAYDDCNEYLQMTHEQLRAWALLSEAPQAVLLLPLKWVQENEQYNTLIDCAS